MTVAAFVVSVVAMLLSMMSVAYSRQQVHANKRFAHIEQERLHKECTPQFAARVEDMGGRQRLWLRLDTPRALKRLACST